MTHFFNGKNYADNKALKLKKEVEKLKGKEIKPQLVTILVGNDKASKLFVSLKKKYAQKVGVRLEIKNFSESESIDQVIKLIKELNDDEHVHGVIVQLPLPNEFSKDDKEKIIEAIDPNKDVDGLREDGEYLNPVVKAVNENLSMAEEFINHNNFPFKIVVVGAKGSFGKKIMRSLSNLNSRIYRYVGVDNGIPIKNKTLDADIVISATGKKGIIKKDMVKEGVVLIDVGAPKGDIDKDVYKKASYVSPVPGGVGPAAIACLIENVINSAERS